MNHETDPESALDQIEDDAQGLRAIFPRLSKTYVRGYGPKRPEAFVVGMAPSAQSEIARKPFAGKAGAILHELMSFAGLHVGDSPGYWNGNSWMTNVIKFRTPGNSAPTPVETKAFRQLLRKEWRAVGSPRLVIPIGESALSAIVGKPTSILRAAGKCHYYTGRQTGKGAPTMAIWPMVHPAFVLQQGAPEPLQNIIEYDWEQLGRWRKNEQRL